MGKRVSSLLLALVLCLGLLPGSAWAAETVLPEWRFLFAIFKNVNADYHQNGTTKHTTYTMTQEEINFVREDARDFEEYMNQVGVMRAHVDVVEIDETITALEDYGSSGGWLSMALDAPLLAKSRIDLDRYDHVTCVASLNDSMGYLGLGGSGYENGTGHSFINLNNRDYCMNVLRQSEKKFPPSMYVHEFLHFMEYMDRMWGTDFGLHDARINHYTPDDDNGRGCYTDIILNRARGTAGTGVHPVVWSHSPRVLRSMTELYVPSGVTGIGVWAFGRFGEPTALTRVAIPASVTSVGYAAFYNTSLTDVYYGGTREQWEAIQIGAFNDALTKAAIHCNARMGALVGDVERSDGTVAEGGQTVNWVYDPSSRSLTVSGGSGRGGTLFAARYDGRGRLLGLAETNGTQRFDLSGCREARLFWMRDGTYTPLCGGARIPTGS